jgi:hypothetical protein
MSAQHTPGPWVAHALMVTEADWTPGSHGKGIAHCGVGMRLNTDLEASEANARLIAVAPELYAELEKQVAHNEDTLEELGPCDHSVGVCHCGVRRDVENARALLAKARGEAA